MSESVWDWGLDDFCRRTASDDPTPGGGSAAMVSAVIGIGLVTMALRVSARKADPDGGLAALIESGDRLAVELRAHADADIEAFNGYMAALGLPKASDEDKAARRTAMAAAAQVATEVPLNSAQSALEGLDLAMQACPAVTKHIVSDVGAGAQLLGAALQAVLLNVDINLPSIKDPVLIADYVKSRDHLRQAGADRLKAITTAVAERLGGG